MSRLYTSLALLLLAVSCKIEPQPITYGSDACHFCHMTIVDRQHASELVTGKGKVYTFDAAECMLHFLKDAPPDDNSLLLVSDFNRPGTFIEAESASYLISEKLPSPMGAFLTAFASHTEAEEALQRYGGTLFDWQNLQQHLKP